MLESRNDERQNSQHNYRSQVSSRNSINPEYSDLQGTKKQRKQDLHQSVALASGSYYLKKQRNTPKTKTQARSELPQISHTQNISDKKKYDGKINVCKSILNNKNLKYLFHEYCRQSYIGGYNTTFDQVSGSAEKMTLNKWMVFCKQFQLVQSYEGHNKSPDNKNRLPKKQAVQCFKEATQLSSYMELQAFLKALQLVKQKLKLHPDSLITDILHAESHLSARNRVSNLKISFSGPHKNFFSEGLITQKQRRQQKIRQQQFREKEKKRLEQAREKQREYILHQGMTHDHIIRQMKQRKQRREERSERLKNKSYLQPIDLSRYYDNSAQNNIYLTEVQNGRKKNSDNRNVKSVFNTYSNVYRTQKQRQQDRLSSPNDNKKSFVIHPKIKNNSSSHASTQSKSRLFYEKRNSSKISENISHFDQNLSQTQHQQIKEVKQQQTINKSQLKDWGEQLEVNSEAQSDEILRDHFKNEKKFHEVFKSSVVKPRYPSNKKIQYNDNQFSEVPDNLDKNIQQSSLTNKSYFQEKNNKSAHEQKQATQSIQIKQEKQNILAYKKQTIRTQQVEEHSDKETEYHQQSQAGQQHENGYAKEETNFEDHQAKENLQQMIKQQEQNKSQAEVHLVSEDEIKVEQKTNHEKIEKLTEQKVGQKVEQKVEQKTSTRQEKKIEVAGKKINKVLDS